MTNASEFKKNKSRTISGSKQNIRQCYLVQFQGLFKHFVRKGGYFQGIPVLDFFPLKIRARQPPCVNLVFLHNITQSAEE